MCHSNDSFSAVDLVAWRISLHQLSVRVKGDYRFIVNITYNDDEELFLIRLIIDWYISSYLEAEIDYSIVGKAFHSVNDWSTTTNTL